MKVQLYKLSQIIEEELAKNEKLQEGFLRANWPQYVGKYAKYSEILYFSEGVLFLKIKNSMARQHMYMNKNKILIDLNNRLQEKGFQITEITYR